jgi:hypothetical protein
MSAFYEQVAIVRPVVCGTTERHAGKAFLLSSQRLKSTPPPHRERPRRHRPPNSNIRKIRNSPTAQRLYLTPILELSVLLFGKMYLSSHHDGIIIASLAPVKSWGVRRVKPFSRATDNCKGQIRCGFGAGDRLLEIDEVDG